jgi:hypothetical protein
MTAGSSPAYAEPSAQELLAEIENLPLRLRQFTSVTVKAPNFNPKKNTTLNWKTGLDVHQSGTGPLPQDLITFIDSQLSIHLQEKGYRIVPENAESPYFIQAIAALGGQPDDETMVKTIGLSPGLGGHSVYLDTGSLALLFVDKSNNEIVWRAKVQVFTDQSLSGAVRKERMKMAIAELLSELPNVQ